MYIFCIIFLFVTQFSHAVSSSDLEIDPQTPYRCAMRGICGEDGDLYQNCAYSGPPLPVPYGQDHYYRELCPQLFASLN